MYSINTSIRRKIQNLYLLLDYLIWLVFDISKFKRVKKERIKKVLIIHLGAIGELLITTPLLSALKKNLDCEISFMVSKGKEDILKDNPHLSEIITHENDFKKNVKNLKERGFDLAVIISPGSTKMALMCFLAGIKYRIGGFGGFKRGLGLFYTRRIYPINKQHTVLNNLRIIGQIGINNKNPKLEFYISEKDKKTAKAKIKKLKIKNYVIIHPTFSFMTEYKYPSRLWPSERYAKIIDHLTEKYNVNVLLTGSKKEKPYSDEIWEKLKKKNKAIVTSGIFNLGEIAYVISKAKLWIGTSTGITHLTSSFNIPIIELAGQNDSWQWHPWLPEEKYKVVRHLEKCSGCNLMYCKKKTLECMNAITTDDVIDVIKELKKYIV